jgi:nitrogen fixation/metabolism regulation signal transduction histidine kinase
MLQSISSTTYYSEVLYESINSQFTNLLLIVFACSILLFLSIWILILRFTKRITHPIRQLTRITEIIKQATGREGREKVLSVIENEPIFEKTKRILRQEEAILNSRRGTANLSMSTNSHRNTHR